MKFQIDQFLPLIRTALYEDMGNGDITTNLTIPAEQISNAKIIAKEDGIIAGVEIARQTFLQCNPDLQFKLHTTDGSPVSAGETVLEISGNSRAILSAERVALNFMQRMSGIASYTNKFVQAVKHTNVKILDTRKTVPGLRLIDKWAVKLGGGENHRIGLYDMVLIKDNHISAAGSISTAVNHIMERKPAQVKVEVEVKNLDELIEVLSLKVDQILLDNMSLTEMEKAVEQNAGKIPLEASGNVNLNTVVAIAETGVDYISVGSLTHSAKALDISLLFK